MLFSGARAQHLPLKAYTVADGLPNNVVNKIVRDSRGFLWFCTQEGLSRFDGYSFTNYGVDQGLPHPTVNDFLETRNGELWIGTNAGLALFNPRGEPTARIVSANQKVGPPPMFTVVVPEDEDRQARAVIVLYEDREGTIWCGTMKCLYRLERHEDHFKLLQIDMGPPGGNSKEIFVLDLLEDRSGSLWVASFGGLFRRRPDGRIAHYTKRDGLPDEVIQDLLEDHQGRLWAGTRLGGFFRFVADDTHNSPFVAEIHNQQDGFPTNWVFQLFETSDHKFWLATNAGLVEFFPDSERKDQLFSTYTRRSGLSYHEITALNEDMSGNLWLGTNVTGAMRLERNGFITYDEQDGLETVNAIFEDHEGGVCFRAFVLGDSRGAKLNALSQPAYRQQLGRYDDQGFTWFMPEVLNKTGWVFEQVTLQARDGEWWVGTGAGLYRFPAAENFTQIKLARPLAVYTTADGLAAPQVFRLFEDSSGAIWVSTIGAPNGLARWRRPSATMEDLANTPGLPSPKDDLARSFGEDRSGNIWIGFGGGLARYRQDSFTFFTSNEGLPPGGIQNIHSDHAGRLWLGSSRSGLIRVDDPAAERPVFTSYTTAQGLSSNSTEAITEDLQGRIYVGTGRGLDQLDPETGRVKHFTTADGLATGAMNAAFRDRSGALWFGTQKGLSRYVPASDRSATAPPILINGLRVSGSPQHVSALGEKEMTLPDFPAGQNQMQIDFVGLSFAPGDVLRYQYKLEGTNADWSAPTEQRTVNYANLAPGRYRFLVRAVTSDGIVSSAPAVVAFTILPHIWQRWWFFSLIALLLIASAYAAYRYRLRRVIELERVRTRIASDLHDDIGSNLSLIAGLSEVLGQSARRDNPQMAERLSVMADVSRRSVEAMSDIVWAVNPRRDNVLDLAARMRRFANDSFAARNIQFHFDAPKPDRNVRINAEVRREVFLVFKEGINNIARHSGCKTAKVTLKIERGMIILKLSDDGSGFDEANIEHGQGLISMRRRAEKVGGRLDVISQPGAGTTVILEAPLGHHG
ncbi:MAG TPA: two-component regulator propeller domain-containing protein [Pyrinomonadaceae bacterium]|nr:two-component regulator propeller domain-containing protein [Pyrinomonadaceae bacterium]